MIARFLAEQGSGPPLLYVPGLDGTGRLLLGTEVRLARHFRLLRASYPNEPAAERTPDTYPQLAASLASGLAERGLERVLVLADSFGGALAFQLALDHPECVAGLAVVNGFAHYRARGRLALSRFVMRFTGPSSFALGRRLGVSRLFGPRRTRSVQQAFLAATGAHFGAGYPARLAMIGGLDLRPRLAEVHQPVALYASDRDSIVDSVRSANSMAELLPDATIETLENAGHVVLPLDEEPWPERMAALGERCGVTLRTSRGA